MISNSQKKFLRSLSHDKSVAIWIGRNGVTVNVSRDINEALNHHELVKVKIRNGDRELRNKLIDKICSHNHAQLIQGTGNVISIYRHNDEKPVIKLPK